MTGGGFGGIVEYGAFCELSNAAADVCRPENLPAQPRQYFARSLFAVWHELQNLVMAWSVRRYDLLGKYYFVTPLSACDRCRLVRQGLISVYE